MTSFTIFPAIDLRQGQVVRLQEGDPTRQKTYGDDPVFIARQWLHAGAEWLHVVNLDGAFGETDSKNKHALLEIIKEAETAKAKVQFGGGIRTDETVAEAFSLGVSRVVLGTMVIENPDLLPPLLDRYGAESIAVSLDARNGMVLSRGWQTATLYPVKDLAQKYKLAGLRWLVFTDIARDGGQTGLNLPATLALKQETHLNIIASGGVASWNDIYSAYLGGLAGVIVGKALYEGIFDPQELFQYPALQSKSKEAQNS